MKIIILGTLRTRSSYLLNALSKNYNLKDKWEPYEDLMREKTHKTLRNDPDSVWPIYKKATIEMTENFMREDNFVLKLFSHAFFNSNKIEWELMKGRSFILDSNDMLDLDTHFNLSHYDSIYFLTRKDYVNNVCSYLFGENTKLLYTVRERNIIKLYRRPMFLHYKKLHLQIMIIKNMLMEVFEKKLIETSLPYTKLDYDDVPNYVKNTFPNITNDFVETNFDYKSLIKNYDQIVNIIEEEKLKFQPVIDNLLS